MQRKIIKDTQIKNAINVKSLTLYNANPISGILTSKMYFWKNILKQYEHILSVVTFVY